MKTTQASKKQNNETTTDELERSVISRVSHVEAAGLSGSLAGAAIGAMAGPAGVIAGGLIGTLAGAFAGRTLDQEEASDHAEDARLDQVIGVSGGPMGAASPNAPKARTGCYSAGSAGVSGTSAGAPAEGPMQDLEDDT